MQFLGLLVPLVALVSFVAFIWLVVVAFKHSPLWGVLVLLLSPITAIIFAVKNWEASKKPFLAYVGSTAACFALVVAVFVTAGAQILQSVQQIEPEQAASTPIELPAQSPAAEAVHGRAEPMDNLTAGLEPAAEPEAVTEGFEDRAETMVENAPAATTAVLTTRVTARNRERIPLSEIGSHVGEVLRIVNRDGSEIQARFVGQAGDELEFERRISAGTIAVHLMAGDIRSLHPLPPQPVEPSTPTR